MSRKGTGVSPEETGRQRERFLLLIVGFVAAIYALWGLSRFVASGLEENGGREEPQRWPAERISGIEADLSVASSLLGAGRHQQALAYLERAEKALEALPQSGLRPAQSLRREGLQRRLTSLRQQLGRQQDETSTNGK